MRGRIVAGEDEAIEKGVVSGEEGCGHSVMVSPARFQSLQTQVDSRFLPWHFPILGVIHDHN